MNWLWALCCPAQLIITMISACVGVLSLSFHIFVITSAISSLQSSFFCILFFYLLQSSLLSVSIIYLQESYKLLLQDCYISVILQSSSLSFLSHTSSSPPISLSVAADFTLKELTHGFNHIIFNLLTFWTFMPTLCLHGRTFSSPTIIQNPS